MEDWLVLVKSRSGAVSLLRCKSEAEAGVIFDRLNPMDGLGGARSCQPGDIEGLQVIDPAGITGKFMSTSRG